MLNIRTMTVVSHIPKFITNFFGISHELRNEQLKSSEPAQNVPL